MNRLIYALALLFALVSPTQAETLYWASKTMLSLQQSKADIFDLPGSTFRLLATDWPGMEVVIITANTVRAEQLLRKRDDVCTGNKLITEARKNDFLVSELPQTVFPGQRLYVRGTALTQWLSDQPQQTELSLQSLLSSGIRMTFGVNSDRSYGDRVDSLLNTLDDNITLWSRPGDGNSRGLVDMFLAGRVDAMLEYPTVFHHYKKLYPDVDQLTQHSRAISELPEVAGGYIMCSKTDKGKQLMAAINARLKILSQQRRYLDVHLDWFPSALHSDIVDYYNHYYGTHFAL
ncbi:hypothetical protein LJ739_03430 [Aestuariibacter halophilus]|uniref:Solute-binding protein family 3/N-terminal domain-containing protein n=1 Tax=Fluctibacter halophilus TaxID=226011 RepID=A0ABS8G401_9ALTE|nr:hypothetical protein [Aestuariibacter halophilus]MCC2615290.1 hypothetical protein [Aestuariibacter halophilus]